MSKSKRNIAEMSITELQELHKDKSPTELLELLLSLNKEEMDYFFKTLPESDIRQILNTLEPQGAEHIFCLASDETCKRIISASDKEFKENLKYLISSRTFIRIYSLLPFLAKATLRNSVFSSDDSLLQSLIEKADLQRGIHPEHFNMHNRAASHVADLIAANKLQTDSELDKLRLLYHETLENLKIQTITNEKLKEDYSKENKKLKNELQSLEKEYQLQLQSKIDKKVPEFVEAAITALELKATEFLNKASRWNLQGFIAVLLAVSMSIFIFWSGSNELKTADRSNIDWLFFCFMLLKGIIAISILAAWAKHSYSIANAYIHESLKRSDRTHAINFGKLYLEVYGNNVSQLEMKSAFENWNLESDSAFVKIKPTILDTKAIDQVSDLISSISKISNTSEKKEGK